MKAGCRCLVGKRWKHQVPPESLYLSTMSHDTTTYMTIISVSIQMSLVAWLCIYDLLTSAGDSGVPVTDPPAMWALLSLN